MAILVLSSHFVQLELYCDTWGKRKTLLSGIQHQVWRLEYNPHPPQILHVPKCRPSIFCLFFLLFNLSYVFDFVYEFLLLPMKTGMENLMTEASVSSSSSPSCWLRHLKHRDVSEPELSAFHASLFSLLSLLSQCLFAWYHIKTYLCWDFWNLPVEAQQCPYFPFLLPLSLVICEHSELLLGEWLVPGQTAFNSSHSLHLQSCLPAVQHMLCIPSPCLLCPPWQFNSSCTASCLESPVCSQVSAKMAAVIFT